MFDLKFTASPEVKEYISKLEDALIDVIDGEQAHDLVPSIGCTEERADELVELCSAIIQAGEKKGLPYDLLMKKLQEEGMESCNFDSVVDDAFSRSASEVNAGGLKEQVRYLKSTGMTDSQVLDSVGLE